MSKVIYYKGLTIECDTLNEKLFIEGQAVSFDFFNEEYVYNKGVELKSTGLVELAKLIVEQSPESKQREFIKEQHAAILAKGAKHWNQWRAEHPQIRPLLYDIDLDEVDLSHFNFSNADMRNASLKNTLLVNANFHEANLGGAQVCNANLENVNFCRTDLYKTDFSNANLENANLQGTQLARTNFSGAKLTNCKIYGLSAWDLNVDGAIQKDLTIIYKDPNANDQESDNADYLNLMVDDIQVAQFIYLMLHNEKIRSLIDTMTSKIVLLLGRFKPSRKRVLDQLRIELKRKGFVSIIFDFEKPHSRNFIETVSILAHLSKFVIADITEPKIVIQEIPHIVKNVAVPVIPIVLQGKEIDLITLSDLRRNHRSLLDTYVYKDSESLLKNIEEKIIVPAEKFLNELR